VAVIVLILLFSTNRLRSDFTRSRWRDRVWLSWLAVVLYLLHNVEEYGVDLLGRFHAFPNAMCSTLGLSPFPHCPIPAPFFLAVNLPMFWVGAPIAALLSRRHPLLGLSLYGVIFVNALTHLGALLRTGYNPGVLTAFLLFLPASVWVARTCFGSRELPYGGLVFLIADGVILHIVLIGSAMLFLHGVISPAGLTAIQILNAVLFFVLAWLAEKWWDGRLARSAVTRSSL
jgi:hypothetical protein